MRNSLLDELNEVGYVIIDDFLTAAECAELLAAGRQLALDAPHADRKTFAAANASAGRPQDRDAYFLESGDKVRYFFETNAVDADGALLVAAELALNKVGHALHTEHDVFRQLTCSERVREVCWQLGFRRPAVPQSMYIYKNPGVGGEVTAHQDSTFLHTEPESTIGFWLPLEDATVQNGCLRFIKGSHKGGLHHRYLRTVDATTGVTQLGHDRPAPIYPASSFTTVPVPKGALVLIHGQAVHRSEANRSPHSRHAYTFHVIETDGVRYSADNWLQPPAGKDFPLLYDAKTMPQRET